MERIDTHCHIVPPRWRKYCEDFGHEKPDGMPAIPEWTPEAHIALMDKLNISKSIVSITSPGTHFDFSNVPLARKITREINEDIRDICSKHPSRFGFFASLPLPDVEGSLAEIDYALDHLGADGFALLTNAFGVYLGDPSLDAVFQKLNERNAVVFMHPTQCQNGNHGIDYPLNRYPAPMMEFFFDTTRAVANLLLSGTVKVNPNITFLVSHGGATLPPILERMTRFSSIINSPNKLSGAEAKDLINKQFYFDLAGFPFPDLIHGLLRITNKSRLLYGSDFPYTPGHIVEGQSTDMEKGLAELFDAETIQDLHSRNARKFLNL